MNGTTKGPRLVVKITPYTDQEKRTNGTVSNGSGGPPPPPLPLPLSPTQNKDDTVEMQSIESFKLKNSPSSVIPKPPSTYFLITPNTSPSTTPTNGSPRHPIPPIKPNMNGNINKEISNNQVPIMEKKSVTKIDNNNSQSSVTVSSQAGKIAVKIGTYEGELKQPSRLDFLPQGKTVIDSPKPVILEEVSNGPVVSRLQNELAATLQRSNLKKKTEEENVIIPQSPTKIVTSPTQERPVSLLQSNVEKLAAALSNRVTIKINPENGSR